MQRPLHHLALVMEELAVDTPAQHLLDRFLMAYPLDGEFHRPANCQVRAWLAPDANDSELGRRMTDFSLRRHASIELAVAAADGIVLVPRQIAAPQLLERIVRIAPASAAIFVYGALAQTAQEARRFSAQATERNIPLIAGTWPSATWRLPQVDVPRDAQLIDDLIVVQGEFPLAELHAIDGLLPLLERRHGGESGVRKVDHFQGEAVWKLAENASLWPLLAAALSRSDTPQGDPVRDGRTQDLVRLGLVPKLATNPRAWRLEHADGLRSTVMVLNGVVADFNFAIRTAEGNIISAQLFRPPPPQRHEFSRLAAVIEQFLRSRQPPWAIGRSLLTSQLVEAFTAVVRQAAG